MSLRPANAGVEKRTLRNVFCDPRRSVTCATVTLRVRFIRFRITPAHACLREQLPAFSDRSDKVAPDQLNPGTTSAPTACWRAQLFHTGERVSASRAFYAARVRAASRCAPRPNNTASTACNVACQGSAGRAANQTAPRFPRQRSHATGIQARCLNHTYPPLVASCPTITNEPRFSAPIARC